MDKQSQLLIDLVGRALANNLTGSFPKTADWGSIYQRAKSHEVHTLIYPVIAALPSRLGPDQALKGRWYTETMLSSMYQLQNCNRISQVLSFLHQKQIPVIALKGLVVMNDYPNPELRTMGDMDLLIHHKDLKRAAEILKIFGYQEWRRGNKHITYECPNQLPIELHWSLIEERDWRQAVDFNTIVWDNASLWSIHEAPVYQLSQEDMLLHLLLHMGSHIIYNGFGLRQLCDLMQYVKHHSASIDWNYVYEKCHAYGIVQFSTAVFQVCSHLFHFTVPYLFAENELKYANCFESFIHDILEGGVYGKQLPEREIASSLLY